MANEMFLSILPTVLPWLKIFAIVFIGAIITIIGVILIIESKRRKWKIEVHEMKADGRLHTVGYDKLVEKRLNMGTKTIYWLKQAKIETIPPPGACVDRFKGKEEVDYLRVARDHIPCTKDMTVDYNDPKVKKKLWNVYNNIREKIRSVKTTFFDSKGVEDRFIYIPIQKTLTANMEFKPIDYDMNMMAMNEIHNADEFYQSKYEFWKKYGAIIVFATTIIFLIVLIVLTYEYMGDTVAKIMGQVDSTSGLLNNVAEKVAGGSKPPI